MLKHAALLLTSAALFQSASAANIIPISACADLPSIAADLSAHYYLTQDIDCSGVILAPIPGVFNGELTGKAPDGSRFTIRHMLIEAAAGQPGGFFEKTNHAIIDNINFEKVSVLSDDNTHRGLLAADMFMTLIENVSITDLTVSGNSTGGSDSDFFVDGREGGLAGSANNSGALNVDLKNVQIKQHTWAGGMFGEAFGVEIKLSSVTGLSSIWDWQRSEPYPEQMMFGGLVGYAANVLISESSAQGSLSSPYMAGGLIGAASNVEVKNSYAQVDVFASQAYAGGIIGRAYLDVTFDHVYAAGLVETDKYGRGMIGADNRQGDYPSKVTEGYFDKEVTGREYSGDSGSKARSTKSMTNEHDKTFSVDKGWSRQVWLFRDGEYPVLK